MAAKTKYVGALAAGALVAVSLLVLMLMFEARTAEATFSGKNGKIAYNTDPRGDLYGSDIYTINPDGSGKFRVTNTKNVTELGPAYSPDGKKIAYTDYRQSPATAIYTMSVRGGGKSKVTRGDYPSYSPNGKKIAYVRNAGHDSEIYTNNSRGGDKFQVTNNNRYDFEPSYSPDGKKIAYCAGGKDVEIYTINATGGKPSQLTHNKMEDWGPSYSPDGKKIVFVGEKVEDIDPYSDSEIYTINAGGGGRVQLTHNRRTDDFDPSWGSRP